MNRFSIHILKLAQPEKSSVPQRLTGLRRWGTGIELSFMLLFRVLNISMIC